MDFLTAGLQVVGLGLSLFGQSQQASVAKQQAQVSGDIATQEQSINAQKQQQMQLEANRSQLQNFRTAQQLRAQATAAAVNGGAQFGSGLQGGLAGVSAQSTTNALGVNQGVEISQNIFGYNNKISSDKQQLAQLGGQAATDQGLTNIGGSLMKGASAIGGFGKDAMSFFGSLSGGA